MFKPMLAPNNKVPLKLEDLKYPLLASVKLDGIRCEFIEGQMLSRALKKIVNKQLREKMKPLTDYTEKNGIILDGEMYSHELTFQEITRYVMTQDFEDKKSIKKHGKVLTIPEHFKFYCFDTVSKCETWDYDIPFHARCMTCLNFERDYNDLVIAVPQIRVNSKKEVEELFLESLDKGYEGLILKDMNGRYKCGRGTIKEGLIYKVKPFETTDEKIIEVVQGTEVNPNAEKKVNELGRSVTSKKKDDRILVDMVSDFVVAYKNTTVKVSCSRMTHEQRKEVWKNRDQYVGKIIEYGYIPIGMKDKPRSPRFIRFREDRD